MVVQAYNQSHMRGKGMRILSLRPAQAQRQQDSTSTTSCLISATREAEVGGFCSEAGGLWSEACTR
jgi:hypothetical protein